MFLQKLQAKKAQAAADEILKWILYIMLLIAATLGVYFIVRRFI